MIKIEPTSWASKRCDECYKQDANIRDIKIGNVCAALCPACLLKLHNEVTYTLMVDYNKKGGDIK